MSPDPVDLGIERPLTIDDGIVLVPLTDLDAVPPLVPAAIVRRERRRRAMGSATHLVAVGESRLIDAALDRAEARIDELEARWSRFRYDSELSRLNREGLLDGASRDLLAIVAAALDAWLATDARFDPTVHDALIRAGYDRSFEQLDTRDRTRSARDGVPPVDERATEPPPGPVGIIVDRVRGRIELPPDVRLDLGGIGKGFAADVVAQALLDDGCIGACVNIGGDVRAIGRPSSTSADPSMNDRSVPSAADSWDVRIEDPFVSELELTRVAIGEGAVATSASVRRRFRSHTGEEAHHLIDPATGRPAQSGLVAVTVVATEACWAAVLSKAAFVAGPEEGAALIEAAGGCGLLVTDEGRVLRTDGFRFYESDEPTVIERRPIDRTTIGGPAGPFC